MSDPIVFLVGPDRCGKTQIAKALAKRLNVPYYKASAEHESFLGKQDRFINDIRHACPARLDLLRQLGCGVVYDRGYPCEDVYSRFYGRATDAEVTRWLDAEYARLGAVVIVCSRRSFVGIKDDLDPRIDEDALQRLSAGYDVFLGWTACRAMKLYVDDEDLGREMADIIKFLEV